MKTSLRPVPEPPNLTSAGRAWGPSSVFKNRIIAYAPVKIGELPHHPAQKSKDEASDYCAVLRSTPGGPTSHRELHGIMQRFGRGANSINDQTQGFLPVGRSLTVPYRTILRPTRAAPSFQIDRKGAHRSD
jgi:hypothetical protein